MLLRGAPDACLAVPIDVNTLVDQNAGALEFEGENLRFECPIDSENELVVQSLKGKTLVDGKKIPRNKKMKLRAGASEIFCVKIRDSCMHAACDASRRAR